MVFLRCFIFPEMRHCVCIEHYCILGQYLQASLGAQPPTPATKTNCSIALKVQEICFSSFLNQVKSSTKLASTGQDL